ncbi:MAG TPA: DedA family protein [Gemmatimonadaceae bacterium]|nr:DedA family protein [Gemmatimonadaceae bacterium]
MLQYLIDLMNRLGNWGYLIIFLGAALECAAFLGLLVPGESLVLVAGFFAHRHVLDLDDVILVVVAGAMIGDNIGYELGRHLGRDWLLHHGHRFGLRESHLARAEKFFARHGGRAVFLGRFVGFARALVPFVAGASRMRYRQFLIYDGIGAVLWGVAFALLGYFLGASWHVAEKWVGRGSAIIGGALLLAGLAVWLRRRRGRGMAARGE